MTTETGITVKVPITVSMDRVRSTLVSAFEGGSNYWMSLDGLVKPEEGSIKDFKEGGKHYLKDGTHDWSWHYVAPFVDGYGVKIRDDEEDKVYVLNYAAIVHGLEVMGNKYPRHFADFLSENDDCETADVLLQCCIFSELVYG